MKSYSPWLFVLCITVLFLCSACDSALATNSAANINSGDVLFSDDFSNPKSGWGLWNKDGGLVEYKDGQLRILVAQNQFDFWSVTGRQFNDVHMEVDTLMVGDGPIDNDFGLICRYKDENNFYMLIISSDGYYGIAKMKDGQYSMIGSDQLQYSTAIAQGPSSNRLVGECVGQSLVLYANDQKLIGTIDSDFGSGDVGLLAGAYDNKNVEILFDNFVVKKP